MKKYIVILLTFFAAIFAGCVKEVEISEKYSELPIFEYSGHSYKVAPAPKARMDWFSAYDYCRNLSIDGFAGWRMPTRDELVQMYSKKKAIRGFGGVVYWSLTEGDYYDSHFVINFSNGAMWSDYRSSDFYVRPIRIDK